MKIKIKEGVFVLQNEGKVRRVVENTTGSSGNLIKGLGADAKPEDVIAAYDRIAGYITGKEGAKVKTGSFYDFDNKKAFEKPNVVYLFRAPSARGGGSKTIEVKAGDPLPLEAQAVQQDEKEKKEKKVKSKK